MATKKKSRNKGDEVKLEMTPMIDVVFQLLIFFIVVLKQEDLLSQLEVLRPASDPVAIIEEQPQPITILIGRTGIFFEGRPVSETELNRSIERVAKYHAGKSIMVKCALDSDHQWLVKTLDICSRHKMDKLSVFSM